MKVDILNGLNAEKRGESRSKYGDNSLNLKNNFNKLSIFSSQLKNPLILILCFAALVSLLAQDFVDLIVIGLIILLNTTLGFFQEYKAQNTLQKLKEFIKPKAFIVLEGKEIEVFSSELVVGDIVILKQGDKVPADGIVIESSNLSVNEAAMTGESLPVFKKPFEIVNTDLDFLVKLVLADEHKVLLGTTISTGVGKVLILRVGEITEFGKLAQSVQEKEGLTPFQLKLQRLARIISIGVIFICVGIFIVGIINGTKLDDTLEISIALAVSAVPEALVISLTVVLALGMQRLLKQKVLVRKMVVAETLGGITTLCIDKTGTLTYGEMSVSDTDFIDKPLAIKALLATNNNLNSVDLAISEWLQSSHAGNFASKKKASNLPFDSTRKYSASVYEGKAYFVGAPEVLLEKSKLNISEKTEWKEKIESYSKQGKRIIACAYTSSEVEKLEEIGKDSLTWLGIIILSDPPRKDIKSALQKCLDADIKIKVITGDYKTTAVFVLNTIGLSLDESQMMSGEELSAISDSELRKKVKTVDLFYRTSPEQKLKIVKALQASGEVVGMMGDGINDAPALKQAEIGIVVNNATDVSKETADMVLLDSNFNSIANAVEEGRGIFENMKNIITYLFCDSFAEILLVGGSIVLGLPLPLTALQILFINFVSDGIPDLALAFDPKAKDLMKRKFKKKRNFIDKENLWLILTIGIIVNIVLFVAIIFLEDRNYSIEQIRSFVFALLVVDSLLYVYSIRSPRNYVWKSNFLNNKFLNLGVLLGFSTLIFSFTFNPLKEALELENLQPIFVIAILVLSFTKIFIIELTKYFSKKI